MGEGEVEGRPSFRKLKRSSYTGYVLMFAWMGIAGGTFVLVVLGSGAGLFLLLGGLLAVVYRISPPFGRLVDRDVTWAGFPALTFLANGLLILMSGAIARLFLRDPFVMYNQTDAISLALWSIELALSIGALVANMLAYRLDLRLRG
jgi:hypothetical protein